jgi:capsular polysaccharide biosynthesis protein
MNGRSHVKAMIKRRIPVVAAAVILATVSAGAIHNAQGASYQANAVLLVTSAAGSKGPGDANQAATLAATYAQVIPNNTIIQNEIAHRLGTDVGHVRADLAAASTDGTSLVSVTFRDPDPKFAYAGAVAATRVLTAGVTIAAAIPTGSLVVSTWPGYAVTNTPDLATTLTIGAILGLIFGLILAVGWERADRRTDRQSDLMELTQGPVSALSIAPASINGILSRWARNFQTPTVRVMFVAGTSASRRYLVTVAQAFSTAPWVGQPKFEFEALTDGSPDTQALEASHADLVVLLVVCGSRFRHVRDTLLTLQAADAPPRWSLLVDPGRTPIEGVNASEDQVRADEHQVHANENLPTEKTTLTEQTPPIRQKLPTDEKLFADLPMDSS